MAHYCDTAGFQSCQKNMSDNGAVFVVERKRERKTIIHQGKPIVILQKKIYSDVIQAGEVIDTAKEKTSSRQVLSLLANVKKCFTAFIIKNQLQVEEVKRLHPATFRDTDKWAELKKGDEFFYVDVSHCYWRISYLMNYISKRLYEETLKKPGMKLYRNMALACVVAPKIREYFNGRTRMNEISEANDIYGMMYDNIRHTAYNIMGEITQQTSDGCYGYKVDGIMIRKDFLKKVTDMLDGYNLTYTVTDCEKIDEKYYYLNDEVRKY